MWLELCLWLFLLPCEFSYQKLSELLNSKLKNQLVLLAPGNHQGTTIIEGTLRTYLSVSQLEFKVLVCFLKICNLGWMRSMVLNWGWFVPRRRHLAVPGDIFNCHDQGAGTTGTYYLEARDATKYPSMHRTGPATKYFLDQMSVVLRLRNPTLAVGRCVPKGHVEN